MTPPAVVRPDITGRADIERLVNPFYDKVRGDEMLGFVFNDMANVIHARINGIEQARFDPANLTLKRRARYASHKTGAALPP